MLRLFKLVTTYSLVISTVQEIIAKLAQQFSQFTINWLGHSFQLKEYADTRIFTLY